MNMKIKSFLILILFLCFAQGCGDEGVLLDGLIPSAPTALPDVGPVPIDIQEIIWGKDVDTRMAELEAAIDADADDRDIASRIHAVCYRREREAYYTKYMNAGGVAIMGNGHVDDRFFYAARDIVLGMTRKRPELLELLTPSAENRPGATQLDTRHDVTGRPTPSRLFRMVLVHNDMSYTSVPEFHLGNGTVQFKVAPGNGSFWPSIAWGYVGGYKNLEAISIYTVFSHEFAHVIHLAIRLLDPTFDDRLTAAYVEALESPHSFNTSRGVTEYWAHSATDWFGKVAITPWYHDLIREHQPLMYALLAEWFGDPINLQAVESRVYE